MFFTWEIIYFYNISIYGFYIYVLEKIIIGNKIEKNNKKNPTHFTDKSEFYVGMQLSTKMQVKVYKVLYENTVAIFFGVKYTHIYLSINNLIKK